MKADTATARMIDQKELRRMLNYDPATGVFTWLVKPNRNIRVGSVAGCFGKGSPGYCYIKIGGRDYLAHRLAWLYMTGEWPTEQIDHRDTDRLNNQWRNLRAANRSQNKANGKRQINNTSGFKGVYWDARYRKFCARIRVNGKTIHLGYRITAEEAHALYVAAALEHYGEFARAA